VHASRHFSALPAIITPQRQARLHKDPSTPPMDSPVATLCTAGCGFYGNPQFSGLCSHCYKSKYTGADASASPAPVMPASSAASRTDAMQTSVSSSSLPKFAASSVDSETAASPLSSSPAPAPIAEVRIPAQFEQPITPTKTLSAASAAAEPEKPSTPSSAAKPKNRCALCRQKVGLLGFTCKCEQLLCAQHRHADQHSCTFDYKAAERVRLEKLNPKVVADKVHNKL